MKQLYKLIAMVICVAVFSACSGKPSDISQPTVNQGSVEVLSPLALAKQSNPDTVAWLKIPDTEIDSPVMQTANNDDYLRKNESGEDDIWGCYFADYYSVLTDAESLKQNTVIYGHSDSSENPNGKRFTQLFKYLDLEFLKKNHNIYLDIGDEKLTFEVFAVFFTDTDFYYIDPQPNDQGFDEFMKTVSAKNEYIIENSKITDTDKLLTLSACAYRYDTQKTGNQRIVVMAKQILQEKEPQPFIAELNPSPQRP